MLRKLMCVFKRPKKEPNFCIECKHFAPDEEFDDDYKKCDYGHCLAEPKYTCAPPGETLKYVCPEIYVKTKVVKDREYFARYYYATTVRTSVGEHCPLFTV